MTTLDEAARDFFSHQRFAVIGVSRKGDTAANPIYRKIRGSGRTVFPVNPNASTVEGDRCWPSLSDLPERVDAVVIASSAPVALEAVRESAVLGIRSIWIHGTFGGPSEYSEAIAAARDSGISVIPGSCPMMYLEPVDAPHRCIRWFRRALGREAAV